MMLLSLLTLAVLLALALARLWRMRRWADELLAAIRARRTTLPGADQAAASPAWRRLWAAVNELLAENQTLGGQRADSLVQLEAMLGNLREAVLIIDESNYIHLANPAMREIFPGARDLINLRLELIVRSADFLEFAAAIRAGRSLPRQEFTLHEGGTVQIVEASGADIPSPDGKTRWALFVVHDVTAERKLERMRRDFVANASHELRTPLSMIKGYVETLVDGHTTMPVEDRTRFLRTIQRNGERLHAIIEDLLVLSRLESDAPGLHLEPVALVPLLEALGEEYRQRPDARGHVIEWRLDPLIGEIQADALKLTQIVTNLLDNAIRHTPAGSAVSVTAAGAAGGVEIAVRDNGPGIPAADLPFIFERFYRVDKGRSRETGGTGLGLSIVKHMVQLHGGRVWVKSEPGQGTTVILRLPSAGVLPAASAQ